MLRAIRTDYEARTSRGVPVHTFSEEATARAWVKANAGHYDGLTLHCVEYLVNERRVYRPRPSEPLDLAIPAMGARA